MIECRNISQQLMPELCAANNLQGIEHYPNLLKEILQENSEVDCPFIVVLTPGRFNSAYYEHAFWRVKWMCHWLLTEIYL